MKGIAQRLHVLETDLTKVKAARASQQRKILLRTTSLTPYTTMNLVKEWRALWLSHPVEIERQMEEIAVLGINPITTTKYIILSQWVMAITDTPEDKLLPLPPEGVRYLLEAIANHWEFIAQQKCATRSNQQQAALWWAGFCRYYACLAQVLENSNP